MMVLEHHHFPMEEVLSRDEDTRLRMTRPEVLGHNPAKRAPLALEGKPQYE